MIKKYNQIIWITIIGFSLIGCVNSHRKSNFNKIETHKNKNIQTKQSTVNNIFNQDSIIIKDTLKETLKDNFNIPEFKKYYDSLLSIAINKKISTKLYKFEKKKILFNELKGTKIENITNKAVNIENYAFKINNSRLRNINSKLIIISYPSKHSVDSVYSIIANEAKKNPMFQDLLILMIL